MRHFVSFVDWNEHGNSGIKRGTFAAMRLGWVYHAA